MAGDSEKYSWERIDQHFHMHIDYWSTADRGVSLSLLKIPLFLGINDIYISLVKNILNMKKYLCLQFAQLFLFKYDSEL